MTKPRKPKTDNPDADHSRRSSHVQPLPDSNPNRHQSTTHSEPHFHQQEDQQEASRTFQVGYLYEKYKGQGVSQKDFVNLLTDLGEKDVDAFSWRTGGQSVLFDAGRLFQQHAAVDDGFIKEHGFIHLIRNVNTCAVAEGRTGSISDGDHVQPFIAEFTAGRVFQSFAALRPAVGLTKREFELLLSNSPIGARIHQMAKIILANPNPTINPNPNMRIPSEAGPGVGLPLPENHVQGPGIGDGKVHVGSYAGTYAHVSPRSLSMSWGKEMRELERLRQEITAYERELQAESSLRKDLPEAYSASKAKILRQNIQALEKKHDAISTSLFALMQAVQNQNQSVGYLQFPQPTHYTAPRAQRYHSNSSLYAYPSGFYPASSGLGFKL